jgi:hypothetical protein
MPGTYSMSSTSFICLPCLEEVKCLGRDILSLNEGRWRSNISTDNILTCPLTIACLGGVNVSCTYGYNGTMCHECIGYDA